MKIVLASKNAGKAKEYRELLGSQFEIVTAEEVGFTREIPETGKSFAENALMKAIAVNTFCRLPTLADDSGLCVEALNDEPGIFSARYAGEGCDDVANYTLLLKNLGDIKYRKAHFETALVLILPHKSIMAYGRTEGEILYEPQGNLGFGYDPVFFSYDLNKSFGLATMEEKNSVSHRKRAVANLLDSLEKLGITAL